MLSIFASELLNRCPLLHVTFCYSALKKINDTLIKKDRAISCCYDILRILSFSIFFKQLSVYFSSKFQDKISGKLQKLNY